MIRVHNEYATKVSGFPEQFVQVRKKMTKSLFEALVPALGAIIVIVFCFIVSPPLATSDDIVGPFGASFVNPFLACPPESDLF